MEETKKRKVRLKIMSDTVTISFTREEVSQLMGYLFQARQYYDTRIQEITPVVEFNDSMLSGYKSALSNILAMDSKISDIYVQMI